MIDHRAFFDQQKTRNPVLREVPSGQETAFWANLALAIEMRVIERLEREGRLLPRDMTAEELKEWRERMVRK